jgi:hypothetical protein
MHVLNIHEREFLASSEKVGSLVDSLSSASDGLWPKQCWPAMQFDRPLGIGAIGGHGPIGYSVETYTPGKTIQFRFLAPRGFNGWHRFEIIDPRERSCTLRHTIDMTIRGAALLMWPLVIRPLHEALLEDAFTTAQASLGLAPEVRKWSLWVRFLKRALANDETRRQRFPHPALR